MASQDLENHVETSSFCLSGLFIFKPCFGIRIDIAIKIIAVINMMVGIFVGISALFGLVFFCLRTQELLQILRNNGYEPLATLARLGPVILASLLFALLVVAIVLYLIGLLLWVGVIEYCYDLELLDLSPTLPSFNGIAKFILWLILSGKEIGVIISRALDPIILSYNEWLINSFRKRIKSSTNEHNV